MASKLDDMWHMGGNLLIAAILMSLIGLTILLGAILGNPYYFILFWVPVIVVYGSLWPKIRRWRANRCMVREALEQQAGQRQRDEIRRREDEKADQIFQHRMKVMETRLALDVSRERAQVLVAQGDAKWKCKGCGTVHPYSAEYCGMCGEKFVKL